jgi:protocatechuate 3,4-dioxygenase beta subunit
MKRGHFLKSLGGLSLMPFLPKAQAQAHPSVSNCILVPSETPGPFPLDLTDNAYYFRQDIREDREGVRLRQKVRIIGAGNCQPMPGVRVNIWHCDRDGDYSGYGTEAGLTYCRGYQITDENGECEFITIVPGWYPGRVTHVHFQVHVSTQYSAVSQWTWPHDDVVQAVLDHAALYPEGPDPLTPAQDGVFADGYDLQMATLDWDADAEEYVSEFEATVEGEGTVGVGYEEMRTAQVMEWGQHYPNPARDFTVFPLVLHQPGMVSWAVYDLQGSQVAAIDSRFLPVGQHDMRIDFSGRGFSRGSYVIQFEVEVGLESHVLVRRFALVD